jgi:hypothetical protein
MRLRFINPELGNDYCDALLPVEENERLYTVFLTKFVI